MKITKEDLKQLILESMQELKEEADFKLPGKSYWENQKDLKEKIYQMALRYKKFKPLKSKNFELYPIIQEVYKNEPGTNLIKSYVFKKGNISEKQLDFLLEKLTSWASIKYSSSYGGSQYSKKSYDKMLTEIGEDGIRQNKEF